MNKVCRKMVRCNLRRKVNRRLLILRRCILRFWNRILVCSLGKPAHYRVLEHPMLTSPLPSSSHPPPATRSSFRSSGNIVHQSCMRDMESDLVPLKISLLGDCRIGKTSFLAKYVGNEIEQGGIQKNGPNLMDKTLMVEGARITYSLWEIDGRERSRQQLPMACIDSVAIFIMFDLTSRVTLNSVIGWFHEARKWNPNAIPVIVGTKFDEFIQLPIDLQWEIASQARSYAKALNATLFFSSASYNINVNKVFKFVTAKLFDLPWKIERNLRVGEPIIDF
ncbi:hypothetical protein K2173_018804 [Erythroxylum novogranatense]|uniref:Septum-promoting GTP-binding protein 1 n=1 Tax=Erythroxylum novogranatense TaxID=1862640 RepID=A0AAV8SAR6_9ROSI|nr:hypothetical protein K2173_018804 [Erythroxylum novogranatense]